MGNVARFLNECRADARLQPHSLFGADMAAEVLLPNPLRGRSLPDRFTERIGPGTVAYTLRLSLACRQFTTTFPVCMMQRMAVVTGELTPSLVWPRPSKEPAVHVRNASSRILF